MQEFFIKKGSVNPVLEMELINDGRYSFHKSLFNNALQDSTITFTMVDVETNVPKILKAKANIVLANSESCEEKYVLQYQWTPRDVNREGIFKGTFEITFNGNVSSENAIYPEGNLVVPVEEDLMIIVK